MGTIMIVEDNELNAKLFKDLLEAHGHRTVETRDGKQAVELAQREVPDLILMDIQLPEISGLDITRRIKQDDAIRHIPVVAVTAFAMKDDEQKILQAGCEGYISKPISIVPFMEIIDRFLGKNVVPIKPTPTSEDAVGV